MMLKNKLLILVIVLLPLQAFTQGFKIKGNIFGYSNGSIIVKDIGNKQVMDIPIVNGEIKSKSLKIEPGLYQLQIGSYTDNIFLTNKVLKINGYIDVDNVKACEIQVIKGEENKHLKEVVKDIDAYVKSHMTSLDAIDGILKYVKSFIDKEENDELAAYIAYRYKYQHYEHAKLLYDALSEKGKKSISGRYLKAFMDKKKNLANGATAPDFVLNNLKGEKVSISDFKGSVVVIDFWASWCGPCKKELKYIKEIYEELKDKKVKFISVSLDKDKAQWLNAIEEEGISWINLRDPKGWKTNLTKLYDFSGIPFIVVLDKNGNIAGKGLYREHLRNKIIELLK